MAQKLLYERFINREGGPERNLAGDVVIEYDNRIIKLANNQVRSCPPRLWHRNCRGRCQVPIFEYHPEEQRGAPWL
jgi:hypothetical protein